MKIQWKRLYTHINGLRKDAGYSWRGLAKAHNLTPSSFTRMEQGKPLSSKNLIKVLDILDPSRISRIWPFVKS